MNKKKQLKYNLNTINIGDQKEGNKEEMQRREDHHHP